ncbi:O-methyltransferase-domain-containing protein [Melampsora americana]|nr:O-methyltransferase-domain-containing protein [Melampsora americana]
MPLIFEVCSHHSDRISKLINVAKEMILKEMGSIDENEGKSKESLKTDLSEINSVLDEAYLISNQLESYVQKCSNVPDPNSTSTKLIEKMIKGANETDWKTLHETGSTSSRLMPAMSSNLYEVGIYKFLIDIIQPKRVLEIGMFTGTITTLFGSIKSVEKVISLEYEAFLEDWCRKFWKDSEIEGLNGKIEIKIGAASDSIEKMVKDGEEPFDLILIDADKESYLTYFQQIIKHKLLSKCGVLLIDNVLFRGTSIEPFKVPSCISDSIDVGSLVNCNESGKSLNSLNLFISQHDEVEVIMLPIRDGLSLVKWKSS